MRLRGLGLLGFSSGVYATMVVKDSGDRASRSRELGLRVQGGAYGFGFGYPRSPRLLLHYLEGRGDLVSSYFCRLIRIITPIRALLRVLISLLVTHLLSPPTLLD